MTDPFSAPQQPGTPAPPPPPPGPPSYYAPQAYPQQQPPGPPAYYAPQAYPQQAYPQPPRKSSKGLIIGIVVGITAAVVIVLGILAAIAVPIFLDQREKANDAAAKADVAALGYLIATYYVDHDGEVPPIEVVGGYYAIDGVVSEYDASVEVELGGAEGTGYNDWCVWVTAPDGADKTFEYSFNGGLKVGTC